MGLNVLTKKKAGDAASQEDVNQAVEALIGDVVPRNAQGSVQAAAGNLGTNLFPWAALYANDLFINGQRLNFGAGGQSAQIANGVLSAISTLTTARNWIRQAGSRGVTITASAENPLQVQVGGETYTLTANLTGGSPLPANYTQAVALESGVSLTQIHPSGVALDTLLAAGGLFRYSPTTIAPDSLGDTFVFKVSNATGTEYIVASRADAPRTFSLGVLQPAPPGGYAKLAIRGAMNTATSAGFTVNTLRPLTATQAMTQIRCGHIFADPTTATWTLSIEARVRTSVYQSLPNTGNTTGDMVYRGLDHRWYRYSGTAWVQTSRVYLGICAIEAGAVVGVMPVITQDAMNSMDAIATRLLTTDGITRSLDNAVHLRCDIVTIASQRHAVLSYYGDDNNALGDNYIQRTAQTYITQNAVSFEPRAVFSLEGTASSILANGRQVFLYASAVTGAIYASLTLPTFINRGNLVYGVDTGNLSGVLLSSFAIDSNGNYIDHPTAGQGGTVQRFPYIGIGDLSNVFGFNPTGSTITRRSTGIILCFSAGSVPLSGRLGGIGAATSLISTMRDYAEQLFEESGE